MNKTVEFILKIVSEFYILRIDTCWLSGVISLSFFRNNSYLQNLETIAYSAMIIGIIAASQKRLLVRHKHTWQIIMQNGLPLLLYREHQKVQIPRIIRMKTYC